MSTILELPAIVGPGVYRNVPQAEYHQMPGASSSRLKQLDRSPAHALACMQKEEESTDAQVFGSALHCALLEPHLFDHEYAITEQCFSQTGKSARCSKNGTHRVGGVSWHCGQHSGGMNVRADDVVGLTRKEYDRVHRTRGAILAHPAALYVLSKVVDYELTVLWTDPATGVLCRMRADGIAPTLGATVEIKTAEDASVSGFTRAVYKWRYYRQAAHYMDGANAVLAREPDVAALLHDRGFHKHIIIAAEKSEPHAVNVFPLRDDAIEAGRTELRSLLARWKACEESGEWPQQSDEYSLEPTDVSLPPYAWREIDAKMRSETEWGEV